MTAFAGGAGTGERGPSKIGSSTSRCTRRRSASPSGRCCVKRSYVRTVSHSIEKRRRQTLRHEEADVEDTRNALERRARRIEQGEGCSHRHPLKTKSARIAHPAQPGGLPVEGDDDPGGATGAVGESRTAIAPACGAPPFPAAVAARDKCCDGRSAGTRPRRPRPRAETPLPRAARPP